MILRLLTGLFLLLATTGLLAKSSPHIFSYTDVGKGKTIILIHAFPTDQRLWQPQLAELKNHFRVIALDLNGFGQTAAANGNAVTMQEYADEIHELMKFLRIQKAIIGGESMGGYIALSFLAKYPDNVEGLILSDSQSIADSPETKAKREVSARDVLEHGSSAFNDAFMAKALSSNASDETKLSLRTIVDSQPAASIASALRGMALRDDTSDVLAKTLIPILIITGQQDILISPQQSKYMHAIAKNSKLVTLSNAGHLSNLEQPEQWNQAVNEMFF